MVIVGCTVANWKGVRSIYDQWRRDFKLQPKQQQRCNIHGGEALKASRGHDSPRAGSDGYRFFQGGWYPASNLLAELGIPQMDKQRA